MKYKIVDEFQFSGRCKVIVIEFDKPQLRKDIYKLIGNKINRQEIINIELYASGESCYHKNAGLLIRK